MFYLWCSHLDLKSVKKNNPNLFESISIASEKNTNICFSFCFCLIMVYLISLVMYLVKRRQILRCSLLDLLQLECVLLPFAYLPFFKT